MKKLTPEQVARLTPEVRARYENRLKRVQRNRRILAGVIIAIAAALVFAILSLTVLFKISSVDVAKTGKIYSKNDIISASGLNIGENMVLTKFDVAENRIETMLPYVLEAKISKSLSGRITISVTDDTAAIIFEAENGYALADANGKVLEVLKEEPEDSTFLVLKTKNIPKAAPGQTIGFADETEEQLYSTVCGALNKAQIFDKTTAMDISEAANIKIIYQNRLRIKIGSVSDIDAKLEAAVKTIAMEDESNPNTIAEINATTAKKIYVNPLDTLDETAAEETENKPAEETTSAEAATEENENQEEETAESEENTGEEEESTTDADEGGESENDEDSDSEE